MILSRCRPLRGTPYRIIGAENHGVAPSLTAPIWFALLQISPNSFSEIGTTVDTRHYIVEIDSLFCCVQASLCFLHRPDRERSKSADLLSDLGDMRDELLFISNRGQKAPLQSVARCEQTPGKEHFLGSHRAK